MNILPIKLLTEIDQPIFGAKFLNLAKLERDGFPVLKGIVVCPPEIILQTVFKHFQYATREVFEQRLTILKGQLSKIPISPELDKELGKGTSFFLEGELTKKNTLVWVKLLEKWTEEIKKKIWQEGFSNDLNLCLSPKAVFYIKGKPVAAKGYFDPHLDEVIIRSETKLEPRILKKIDELVLSANKRLFIPQVYEFLKEDEKVYLIGLSPYTQTLPVSKTADIVLPKKQQLSLGKYSIKMFLNLSSGFAVEPSVDGVLIKGERAGNLSTQNGFEETVFKLSEAALSFVDKPIIYQLPDVKEKEVEGALRLIHDTKLLDKSSQAFLFARNKRNLLNLGLAVPLVRSADELLTIKRELAVRGITRKGALKLWMEVCVPENILNLEDYLTVGIDGVILNLDLLQQHIGGYKIKDGQYYQKNTGALAKFIKPLFKTLHKAKVPVLITGELTLHPDILELLIEEGVWGVVVNTLTEASSIPDHLSWMERRMIVKRFA